MTRHKDVPKFMTNQSNHIHKEAKRAGPDSTDLQVKWPCEGNVIAQPGYTFHIEAGPEAQEVEVSINMGNWLPCRKANGVWWYDWSGYAKGDYELEARCRSDQGVSTLSSLRRFSVG